MLVTRQFFDYYTIHITTGIQYRIPLVSTNAGEAGRFESSDNYDLTTYTNQSGDPDMIHATHEGRYSLNGVSQGNGSVALSMNIDSKHDFAANFLLHSH